MIACACHCGDVRLEVARKPRTPTECNCSICRRYAGRWAYYSSASVRIHGARASTVSYVWGDRLIRMMRCRRCGCVMYWEPVAKARPARMGVNMRNADPAAIADVRVRHIDGARTWKFLD